MPTYSVPIWVYIQADNQEEAWKWVSNQVNQSLADPEVIAWETGEPILEEEE